METPQKQLYERTITKSFQWGPLYANNVFEFLQGEDDEAKQQILNHIKSVRVTKITGTYRYEKFVVEPEMQMQFVRPDPRNCDLKNVLHLDWLTSRAPVNSDYFLGMSFGLCVTGSFNLETGKVFLALLLSGDKDDKLTKIDAIYFTEVEIELIYESDTPAPARFEKVVLPKTEPEPSTEETPATPAKPEKQVTTITVKSDDFGDAIPIDKACCKGVTDIRVRTIEGHAFFGPLGNGKFSAKADDKLVLTKVDPTKISNLHADLVKEGYYNDLWKLNNETVLVTAGSFADNVQMSFLIYVDAVANCDTGTINVRASEGQIDVTPVSEESDDPVTLHNRLETCRRHSRVEINSVELAITHDPSDPAEATPEPEKKSEAAEVPQPSNDDPVFCCHCNANLTQAKEYVVLKEVEMMFPGPDIVTKHYCCPDCYDFMRKARARVLDQMSGILDHSKVVRVMSEWFHMFVTEAESKRKLDAERASNTK